MLKVKANFLENNIILALCPNGFYITMNSLV